MPEFTRYFLFFDSNVGTPVTVFIGNSANSDGGAIYIRGGWVAQGSLTIMNAGSIIFSSNTATDRGGAIYSDRVLRLTGSGTIAFSSNTASQGGAIYLIDTTLSLDGTLFQNNTATAAGGAVYFGNTAGNQLTYSGDTRFIGNSASAGGAIMSHSTLLLTNAGGGTLLFAGNTGGAICTGGDFSSGVSIGSGVTFDNNSSGLGLHGGAIALINSVFPMQLSLDGTVFQNNTAIDGCMGNSTCPITTRTAIAASAAIAAATSCSLIFGGCRSVTASATRATVPSCTASAIARVPPVVSAFSRCVARFCALGSNTRVRCLGSGMFNAFV